jgi:hypothetical protein
MCKTWNSAGSDLPRRISSSNQDAYSPPDRLVIYLDAKCIRGTDSSFVIHGVACNTARFTAVFVGDFLPGNGKEVSPHTPGDFAAAAATAKQKAEVLKSSKPFFQLWCTVNLTVCKINL